MNLMMDKGFQLGRLVATPGALEALQRNNVTGFGYVRRHASGDWGLVCEEDAELNNQAIDNGSRILSAYDLPDETRIWIITDATVDENGKREVTTILLPEDY